MLRLLANSRMKDRSVNKNLIDLFESDSRLGEMMKGADHGGRAEKHPARKAGGIHPLQHSGIFHFSEALSACWSWVVE